MNLEAQKQFVEPSMTLNVLQLLKVDLIKQVFAKVNKILQKYLVKAADFLELHLPITGQVSVRNLYLPLGFSRMNNSLYSPLIKSR